MSRLTEQQKQEIRELVAEGLSSRKIAEQVLDRASQKSTINDFLAREKEGDVAPRGAKVAFIDIEVSASIVAAFNMYRHFSTPDHVMQYPYILTAAWNWLHDDESVVHTEALTNFDRFNEDHTDDMELVKVLWQICDEADILVIHNERFDRGWMNQRFAAHGFPEPSPYRVICTLKALKKNMSLPSNSLNYSTEYFELEHSKLKHEGISLWIECMSGDEDAFERMLTYNKGDIPTLRSLYLKIRPFIQNHPNVALYYGDNAQRCPACGSQDLIPLEGKLARTNLSEFESFRCGGCGKVSRSGRAVNTTDHRKKLLRNVIK